MATADCCARCVNESSRQHSGGYLGYPVKAGREPQVKTWKRLPCIYMTKGQHLGLCQAPPHSATDEVLVCFVLYFFPFLFLALNILETRSLPVTKQQEFML